MTAQLIILSFSLSLDAFFVGMTYKLRGIHIPFRSTCIMLLFSLLYTGISLWAGNMLKSLVPIGFAHVLGALIIGVIGLYTLIKSLLPSKPKKKRESTEPLFEHFFKTFGVTVLILKNPERGDLDQNRHIDPKEALLLGLALSLDSIGAGVGCGLSESAVLLFPFLVALCQIVFLTLGAAFSNALLCRLPISEKTAGVLCGTLLILVAFLI